MTNVEIENLRRELNLSMADFGKLFGVTSPSVIKWERGVSVPSPMIEVGLQSLRNKVDRAKIQGREKEQMETIRNLVVVGGLLVFLTWLFTKD